MGTITRVFFSQHFFKSGFACAYPYPDSSHHVDSPSDSPLQSSVLPFEPKDRFHVPASWRRVVQQPSADGLMGAAWARLDQGPM